MPLSIAQIALKTRCQAALGCPQVPMQIQAETQRSPGPLYMAEESGTQNLIASSVGTHPSSEDETCILCHGNKPSEILLQRGGMKTHTCFMGFQCTAIASSAQGLLLQLISLALQVPSAQQ